MLTKSQWDVTLSSTKLSLSQPTTFFTFYPFNPLLSLCREWVTSCVGIGCLLDLHYETCPSQSSFWMNMTSCPLTQNFYKIHIWLSVVKPLVLFYIDCFSPKPPHVCWCPLPSLLSCVCFRDLSKCVIKM